MQKYGLNINKKEVVCPENSVLFIIAGRMNLDW